MVAPPGSVNDSSTAFEPTAGGRGANRTAIMSAPESDASS